MSKITNDGLTRSGTGCFLAVSLIPYANSIGVKVLNVTQRFVQHKKPVYKQSTIT